MTVTVVNNNNSRSLKPSVISIQDNSQDSSVTILTCSPSGELNDISVCCWVWNTQEYEYSSYITWPCLCVLCSASFWICSQRNKKICAGNGSARSPCFHLSPSCLHYQQLCEANTTGQRIIFVISPVVRCLLSSAGTQEPACHSWSLQMSRMK